MLLFIIMLNSNIISLCHLLASEAASQRRSMHSGTTSSKVSLKRTQSQPSGKLPPVQHSKSGQGKALQRKTQVGNYHFDS